MAMAYAELASLDAHQAWDELIRRMLAAAVGLLCLLLAAEVALVCLIGAVWDSAYRNVALGTIAGVLGLAGWWVARHAGRSGRAAGHVRAEWRVDREAVLPLMGLDASASCDSQSAPLEVTAAAARQQLAAARAVLAAGMASGRSPSEPARRDFPRSRTMTFLRGDSGRRLLGTLAGLMLDPRSRLVGGLLRWIAARFANRSRVRKASLPRDESPRSTASIR